MPLTSFLDLTCYEDDLWIFPTPADYVSQKEASWPECRTRSTQTHQQVFNNHEAWRDRRRPSEYRVVRNYVPSNDGGVTMVPLRFRVSRRNRFNPTAVGHRNQ